MAIMLSEIDRLVAEYSNWLRDKTILKKINDGFVELTTPYLDRHNDYLQFYISKDKNGFCLSDDSYILTDLRNSGCILESSKRQDILREILNGFGVQLEGEQLKISATTDNFPIKKHNFVQAMLAVNDMFYLASPNIESLFLEDVESWLDTLEVRYTPNVKFTGKSGFDHMFDFVIPKSKREPERIIQTLNNPKKDTAEVLVFKWIDTRDMRSERSKLIPILNDRDSSAPSSVVNALNSYDLSPVLWSERGASSELFVN